MCLTRNKLKKSIIFCTYLRTVIAFLQVPTEYFLLVLGKHLKYSSCLYPSSSSTLDEAEEAMLGLAQPLHNYPEAEHSHHIRSKEP